MKKTNRHAVTARTPREPEAPPPTLRSLDELKAFAVRTGVRAGAGMAYRCGCDA